jgi:hypothetical protein
MIPERRAPHVEEKTPKIADTIFSNPTITI